MGSALYLKHDKERKEYQQIKQLFDMALQNAFRCLEKMTSFKEPMVTTGQSLDVLETREAIELSVMSANKELAAMCAMIDDTMNLISDAMTNAKVIDNCKDYEFDQKEMKMKTEVTTENVTCCRVCMASCHIGCVFGNDEGKKNCCVMKGDGTCSACGEGKCLWSQHINTHNIYTYEEVVTTKTMADMRKVHSEAEAKLSNSELLFKAYYKDLKKLYDKILRIMIEIKSKNDYLDRIAIVARPYDTKNYFESLINQENRDKKNNYQKRIQMYTEMKQNCQLVKQIATTSDLNKIMPKKAHALSKRIKESDFYKLVNTSKGADSQEDGCSIM